MSRQNMTRTEIQVLRDVIERTKANADSFCDLDSDDVQVPREAREAAKQYIDTWVAGQLGHALSLIDRAVARIEEK